MPLSDRRIVSEDCRLRATPTCGASFDYRAGVCKQVQEVFVLKVPIEGQKGEQGEQARRERMKSEGRNSTKIL